MSRLSSHIEVSSIRAVVTYSWGDFKHDPRQVLARFFDAHLYMANWGSRRLAFRFPAGLVSPDAISACCVQDRIIFKTINGFDILDMDLSEEEGGGWIEGEGFLSGLIPLRKDIIEADYTEPSEAAWELLEEAVEDFLEDMKRRAELGLTDAAITMCRGIVTGLYRARNTPSDGPLGWAPDFPAEEAGHAVSELLRATADQARADVRSLFVTAIVTDAPEWGEMLTRTATKTA